MKTLTIDLKSACFGAFAAGVLLMLFNFKPANQPAPPTEGFRRYQVVLSERNRDIIVDTQTGRFLIERPALGLPRWQPYDFEEIYAQEKK
jgi:hypothetical protein